MGDTQAAGESAHGELRLVPVGDIQERFLVAAYQRGYRWGDEQVRMLLSDLHGIRDKDYCLQPIVVKRLEDGRFELIDGQQRLTTLYLLFLYMKKEGLKKVGAPFSIEYATRPQSESFLRDVDPARADENIDFFHLHAAYQVIVDWFEGHGHRVQLVADEIYGHLGRRAKVIWYEASASDNSTSLFTRLNVGRIPLTNAELIKALLLGTSPTWHGAGEVEDRRKVEMGSQWDMIERDLHAPSFWAFLTNRSGDEYPTRIQLLFDLMAGNPYSVDRFRTFFHFKGLLESKAPDQIWADVYGRYSLLKEWHDDRNLYHHVGYLIATSGRTDELASLVQASEQGTKTEFERSLTARIIDRLALDSEEIDSLEYDGDRSKCERALLLFNVETTRTLKNSFERYPFHAHKSQSWSLEHIHAQNAEILTTVSQWKTWLTEHLRALRDLRVPDDQFTARGELIRDIEGGLDNLSRESFLRLSERTAEMFSLSDVTDSMHGIENLALLPGGANSALGNAVFEVKRRRILKMDREGAYIPICTRRLFLKYYTQAGDQQLQFWSRQDRDAYLSAMFSVEHGVLTPYLRPSTAR